MTHILPVIVIAFLIWQWLSKNRGQSSNERQDSSEAPSPFSAFVEDTFSERIFGETNRSGETTKELDVTDVGSAVAALFGEQGKDFLSQKIGGVVGRALQETKIGQEINRGLTELVEAVEPALIELTKPKKTKKQNTTVHVKYLLDGIDGPRQKIDRTAQLQRAMRSGRGLCSPR